MELYKHTVQYYETDKMGIVHHSNYIRWMEEARIDFLDKIGWNYAKLEENGIVSPVVSLNCNYKLPTVFGDVVSIGVNVEEFKGVKLVIGYEMKNEDGIIVCTANSSHCFLDGNGRPIILKKRFLEFAETLEQLAK
ncbi:MAG: acyl-CoA thioesterase [Lachnospiraceae bacterium]|nr:acyl-CoA thioesterase [Candidatus Colinaster scatohippi]